MSQVYVEKLVESYEVFYPSDHEFIWSEILPSFYHNGPSDGYRVTQLMVNQNTLKMNTYDCDFCETINNNGDLGMDHIGPYKRTVQADPSRCRYEEPWSYNLNSRYDHGWELA